MVAHPLELTRREDHPAPPFDRALVIRPLGNLFEEVAVEAVDAVVHAREVQGEIEVAVPEGTDRALEDLRCLTAHLDEL
jgi:hypothetical protein